MGLTSIPNFIDNGFHGSASPFEALVERNNMCGKAFETDEFGKAMIDSGISLDTIKAWSSDP